ncbi:MAG: hypothetical protein SFY66_15135 [Oculatellaceae cyanobacterium bins.114]|nr:hypothetical protein [Oculatellaceae cyanobacterium bins.114]
MSESDSLFTPQELHEWQLALAEADRHNIFCHCRQCDREWVASTQVACTCGSTTIEYIACWQFPDD